MGDDFWVWCCAAHAAARPAGAESGAERKKNKPKTQMCRGQNPQFSHSADIGQFSAWHGFSRWAKHPPTTSLLTPYPTRSGFEWEGGCFPPVSGCANIPLFISFLLSEPVQWFIPFTTFCDFLPCESPVFAPLKHKELVYGTGKKSFLLAAQR